MRKSYSDKLRDPRWQKKRLEVFERDNFTCLICGDKEQTLNVHHNKYSGEPWESPLEDLSTMCEQCHAFTEGLKKSVSYRISEPFFQTAAFELFQLPQEKLFFAATRIRAFNTDENFGDAIVSLLRWNKDEVDGAYGRGMKRALGDAK